MNARGLMAHVKEPPCAFDVTIEQPIKMSAYRLQSVCAQLRSLRVGICLVFGMGCRQPSSTHRPSAHAVRGAETRLEHTQYIYHLCDYAIATFY